MSAQHDGDVPSVRAQRTRSQLLLCDVVLTIPGRTVLDGNEVGCRQSPEPTAEPARHQQRKPPPSSPADNTVHAVVNAFQECPDPSCGNSLKTHHRHGIPTALCDAAPKKLSIRIVAFPGRQYFAWCVAFNIHGRLDGFYKRLQLFDLAPCLVPAAPG